MKFRPLHNNILVKPVDRVKSDIIQVIMEEKPNMGTVVAVSQKAKDEGVEVGQFIRFGTMGTDEYLKFPTYTEDNVDYLVMSWKDVAWVQENENAN